MVEAPDILPRTARNFTVAPSILVGIGRFGLHALGSLDATLFSAHPDLAAEVRCMHLTSAGIDAEVAVDPACLPPDPDDPAAWLDVQRQAMLETLQRAIVAARGSDVAASITAAGYRSAGDSLLDLYLLADTNDSFARLVLPWCLDRIAEASGHIERVCISLCLGVDSETHQNRSAEEREQLRACFDWLREVVQPQSSAIHTAGKQIGWCYLLDVTDGQKTLARLNSAGDAASPRSDLSAEVLAAYLTLVIGSTLRHSEEYCARDLRLNLDGPEEPHGPLALVSCSSAVVPTGYIQQVCVAELSARIIEEGLLGEPRAEVQHGRDLANRTYERYTLTSGYLIDHLRRDDLRQIIVPQIERDALPPGSDDDMIEQVVAWEARFNRITLDRLLRELRQRADEHSERVADWLNATVDEMIAWRPGGLRPAQALVQTLTERLLDEHDLGVPAERRSVWGGLFLGERDRRPNEQQKPDLEPYRRRLERALTERPLNAAVWIRCGLVGLALFWLVAGMWPYLEGQFGRSLRFPWSAAGGPVDWATLLTLFAVAVVLTIAAATTRLWYAERAILRARGALIRAVERRVQAVFAAMVRAERDRVYRTLLERLRTIEGQLEQWEGRLAAAARAFREDRQRARLSLLCLDRPLVSTIDLEAELPSERAVLSELGRDLLAAARQQGGHWQTWSSDSLGQSARVHATAALRPILDQVYVGGRLPTATGRLGDPRQLLAEMQQSVRPLGNLRRRNAQYRPEQIAGVADVQLISGLRTSQGMPFLATHTADRGRVTYAPVYFGVHFDDLALAAQLDEPPPAPLAIGSHQ